MHVAQKAKQELVSAAQSSLLYNFLYTRARRYPRTREAMLNWEAYSSLWYYSVELLPDICLAASLSSLGDSLGVPRRELLRHGPPRLHANPVQVFMRPVLIHFGIFRFRWSTTCCVTFNSCRSTVSITNTHLKTEFAMLRMSLLAIYRSPVGL
jgi:hypothetical protein